MAAAARFMLSGSELADKLLAEAKANIARLGFSPRIAIVLVGNNEASEVFVRLKQKACAKIGARSSVHRLDEGASEDAVAELIEDLNRDNDVNGILVQLPLPEKIDDNAVLAAVAPAKDVDGMCPENLGRLLLGSRSLVPCTVEAIMRILDNHDIPVAGKDVVVVNRSSLIGKPLAVALVRESATVTLCHTKTVDLPTHTRRADILVTAAGSPGIITAGMVKEGAVVIDAGFAKVGGNICGDVDFEQVSKKASAVTPVPGGVGPVTVAMTMVNLLKCCSMQRAAADG